MESNVLCMICRLRLYLATCVSSGKGPAVELDQWQLLDWLGKAGICGRSMLPLSLISFSSFSDGVFRMEQLCEET